MKACWHSNSRASKDSASLEDADLTLFFAVARFFPGSGRSDAISASLSEDQLAITMKFYMEF